MESTYEVHDYIKSFLGETDEVHSFAKEFLERRQKIRNYKQTKTQQQVIVLILVEMDVYFKFFKFRVRNH